MRSNMYIGQVPVILVRCLTKLDFSQQIFEKYPNTKSYENPFSGSRVIPRGRVDGQTDMLTVALLNFANAPKNVVRNSVHSIMVSVSSDHVTNTANNGLPL